MLERGAQLLRRSEAGAVLVEFALVAPIVLLMLFAMVDLGKAYNYWIDQTHLANEGARWAAVSNWPSSDSLPTYILHQADTTELQSGGTSSLHDPATVRVCFPNGSGSTIGDPVTVTVTSNYNFIPLVNLAAKTITVSSTMRLEANPSYAATGTYDPTSKSCTAT